VETRHHLPIFEFDDCGCCKVSDPTTDESGKVYGCNEKRTVLTPREEEVLKRIRELGLRAKDIRAKIKQLEEAGIADPEAKQRVMGELESVRQLRSELESERIAAAEERMRLLGHT
jgi:hypothetical protein